MRSLERTVAEVLLPALEMAARRRTSRRPSCEHACRWATGWLHGARRLAPRRDARPRASCCSTPARPLGRRGRLVQALELFLRRAGLRVLLLSASLAEARFRERPPRAPPTAVVICGSQRRAWTCVGGPLRARSHSAPAPRLYGYRAARLVAGTRRCSSLGDEPGEATARAPGGARRSATRHRSPGGSPPAPRLQRRRPDPAQVPVCTLIQFA